MPQNRAEAPQSHPSAPVPHSASDAVSRPASHSASRTPRWLRALVGAAAMLLAVALILHPFNSVGLLLILLGAALVVAAISEAIGFFGSRGWAKLVHLLAALVLLGLGLTVLFVPGVSLRLLVLALGAGLLLLGVRDLAAAVMQRAHRLNSIGLVFSGIANLIFGVLALVWVDVSVLVAGALFGLWLLVGALRIFASALRRRHDSPVDRGAPAPPSEPAAAAAGGGAVVASGTAAVSAAPTEETVPTTRRGGVAQLVLGSVALIVAVVLGVVGARIFGTPSPDAFYAAPAEVPGEPGQLLRVEPFTSADIPDTATAWRVLYTTTRNDGVPAVSSGLVVVPNGVDSPPVIAWSHGTNGAAVGCAPTLQADPLKTAQSPIPIDALEQGWAIVATDYIGLGADAPHEYMVGQPAARSVLDAIRSAQQIDGISLGSQVAVWGHSQGGGAALWTGGVAADYAPEIDIVGVSAVAPAADLPALVSQLATTMAGTVVGPLVLAGFAAGYDDVKFEEYVKPSATLMVEETIARCWTDKSMIVSIVEAGVIDTEIWATDPNSGPLGKRLAENVPHLAISAPLMIGQGLADELVLPEAQQKYVDGLCTAGQAVDYRTYKGLGHMGVVQPDSPYIDQVIQWTKDRFDGQPASSTCS